jgi:hypothetical protein
MREILLNKVALHLSDLSNMRQSDPKLIFDVLKFDHM